IGHEVVGGDVGGVRIVHREGGIHSVAVGGGVAILEVGGVVREGGGERVGRGVGPDRRASANEPEGVQEGAAESGGGEVIGDGVLLGQLVEGPAGGVPIAHRQACAVAPGGEQVHLAAVDLVLLAIEGVDHVAGLVDRRDVAVHEEGSVGQVGREAV